MPITEAQRNLGGFNAASGDATLAATTAGNTVVIAVFTYGSNAIATPAGFTSDLPAPSTTQQLYLFRKTGVAAGETTWTLATSPSGTQKVAWVARELVGMAAAATVDTLSGLATATALSISTGPTGVGTAYDILVVAVFGAYDAATTSPPTFGSYSDPGLMTVEHAGAADATTSVGLTMAEAPAPWVSVARSTTADASMGSAGPLAAAMLVYVAAGSMRTTDILNFAGFEWGTIAGNGVGSGDEKLLGGVNGGVTVVATSPRTGSYCLQCSGVNVAANVTLTSGTPDPPALAGRVSIYLPAPLPTMTMELVSVEPVTAGDVEIRYDPAQGTLVAQASTGTAVVATVPIDADTWYDLDFLYELDNPDTIFRLSWQINGVDQPTAASQSGLDPADLVQRTRLGWTGISTSGTARFDDMVLSQNRDNYPLGDYRVVAVGVDPAGTVTASTPANFRVVTDNGTLSSWDDAAAKAAIDDLPPVISSSNDGIAQAVAATTDAVSIPMADPALPADGVVRVVSVILCGWAASASVANLGIRGWDGVSETVLADSSNTPGFDNSTTAPGWHARNWRTPGGWTQDKLAAMVVRLGYSNDATPAIGVNTVLCELAVAAGDVLEVFGGDGALRVEQVTDPRSGAIAALHAYAPAGQSATLVYELGGVEQTPVVVAAGSNPLTTTIDAADATVVNRIELYPDPES